MTPDELKQMKSRVDRASDIEAELLRLKYDRDKIHDGEIKQMIVAFNDNHRPFEYQTEDRPKWFCNSSPGDLIGLNSHLLGAALQWFEQRRVALAKELAEL